MVNTCSFIDTAKQESVDTILEMAQHKVAGRAQKLIVAGCLVERYRNEIQKNIPEVDAVVGTGELEQILSAAGIVPQVRAHLLGDNLGSSDSPFVILKARPEGDAREAAGRFSKEGWDGAIADLPNYLYDENTPRLLATPKYSAYIKIAEGCDHPCSFCIIPQLRGKFRSRRFESVIAEAQRLAQQGVREITLIGQDTTCYGEDLGLKDGLPLLLERLAQIEELRWIRFLYAYPNKITGKLLETIAAHEKICSYIDVPLQHAAPNVLKRMKRGAGAEIFLRSIEKMRREIPDLTLRTSFIVGFPGETEQDFEQLCQFVREAQFDWLGVFGYSDEEGAKAFDLGRQGSGEGDRAPPQEADVDPEADQPQEEARAGWSTIRSAAGRPFGRDRSAVGRPHRDARARDRRHRVRQRFRRSRSSRRRVLSLRNHRSARVRSGRENCLAISTQQLAFSGSDPADFRGNGTYEAARASLCRKPKG